MSYRTRFELKIKPRPSAELLAEEVDGEPVKNLVRWGMESKWFDYDKDMKALSEKYTDHLFILDGYGEVVGDIWRKFYRDGVCIDTWRLYLDAVRPNEPSVTSK